MLIPYASKIPNPRAGNTVAYLPGKQNITLETNQAVEWPGVFCVSRCDSRYTYLFVGPTAELAKLQKMVRKCGLAFKVTIENNVQEMSWSGTEVPLYL